MNNQTQSATIKLVGKGVDGGEIALNELKKFLDGIEKSTKYYIGTQDSEFAKHDYTLNVAIESGSIIVTLLEIAGVTIGTAFLAPYAKAAGQQLAKNDIGDKTTRDVVVIAVKRMKKTIQIAKHLGTMGKHSFPEAQVKFKEKIIIPNEKGEKLEVTKDELDIYSRTPKDLFKNMVSPVTQDIALSISDTPADTDVDSVKITARDKMYFAASDDEADEIVLPELQSGEFVTLHGELTRANTRTGTLGFAYKNHILTSTLIGTTIQENKEALFDKKVEIDAIVTRQPKKLDAEDDLSRPKLEIKAVRIIENEDENQIIPFSLTQDGTKDE